MLALTCPRTVTRHAFPSGYGANGGNDDGQDFPLRTSPDLRSIEYHKLIIGD